MSDSTAISVTQDDVSIAVAKTQSVATSVAKTQSVSLAVAATQAAPSISVASTQASVGLAVAITEDNSVSVAATPSAITVSIAAGDADVRVASLYARYMRNSPLDVSRFTDYDNGVFNSGCWADGLDMTGISLDGNSSFGAAQDVTRRCTLIGRDCAVTAHHFGPRVGGGSNTVIFTDAAGTKFTYTLKAEHRVFTSDIRVMTFTSTVSDTLPSYKMTNDFAFDEWLICSRARREADTGFFTLPAVQDALLDRVSLNNGDLGIGYQGINPVVLDPDWVGLPSEVLDTYYAAADGDSGDPLFKMNDLGILELVSCYNQPTSGQGYGTANLADIDAWLLTQSSARLAQVSSL